MESRRRTSWSLEIGEEHDSLRASKRVKVENSDKDVTEYSMKSGQPPMPGKGRVLKRNELIVLMEQALASLGFDGVGEQLAKESGLNYEDHTVIAFRTTILKGHYEQAIHHLDQLGLGEQRAAKARFLILEQKFLEDLSRGDVYSALKVLQKDLSALGLQQERLHKLAGCILCTSQDALKAHVNWPGIGEFKNRQQLLQDIQGIVPPDIMLPDRRLERLLEQALTQQFSSDNIRSPVQMPVSLLTDYSFSRGHIPTCTTQILNDHTEEVWHVQFSHNGRYLASASKDSSAIIWEVNAQRQLIKRHVLRGHTGPLTFCCWSPDDKLLATCSMDSLVKVWMVSSGICLRTFDKHKGPTTTAAWSPDGKALMTSSEDKWIYHLDPMTPGWDDSSVPRWETEGINELLVLQDERVLITPYGENKIEVCSKLRPGSFQSETLLIESECIVSSSLSSDSTRLLLNMASRAVHLWRVPPAGSREPASLLQKFRGAKERQSRFVVRSCFGGYNDSYVLSGSEECKVFVWHTATGELLASLEGHSGTVNSVSWNPVDHHMFASASDDKSIHLWGLDPTCSQQSNSLLQARAPSSPSV